MRETDVSVILPSQSPKQLERSLDARFVVDLKSMLQNMEEPKAVVKPEIFSATNDLKLEQCVSTNWRITQDNKRLCDTVSTIQASKAPERFTLEDIVSDSCLILQPVNANVDNQQESCTVDINLNASRRLTRIGVVSEGSVLEFFKESGEYAGTTFAELIEEYEDATVYFAELTFERPTAQASIKFTRIHNSRPNMYLYGIKLVLDDAKTLPNERPRFEDILKSCYGNGKQMPMGLPDFASIPDYDGNFASEMQACLRSFAGKAWGPRPDKTVKQKIAEAPTKAEEKVKENSMDVSEPARRSNIELYIDEKLRDMEKRLARRIDEAEAKTNDKLDAILRHLELRSKTS